MAINCRLTVAGVTYELDSELAGEEVVVWWGGLWLYTDLRNVVTDYEYDQKRHIFGGVKDQCVWYCSVLRRKFFRSPEMR